MKGYFKTDQSRGDFSTSFGDMIFGLLFFFFILTLAMVFNRTDVSNFQSEIDKLRAEMAKKDKLISEWEKKYKELELTEEKLKKAQAADTKKLKALQEKYNLLQKQYNSVLASLEVTQKAYDELLSEYNRLSKKQPVPSNVNADVQIQSLERQLAQIIKERDALKTKVDTLQDEINKIKKLLKDKGLTEILAEVEKMEKAKTSSGSGEDILINDYKIWVKLYPYDMDIKVSKGDNEIGVYFNATEDQLISKAKEILNKYKQESASYSEEDRKKHQPKVFLMTHPEVQYGVMQEFLQKIRKVIGVSIVGWKDN